MVDHVGGGCPRDRRGRGRRCWSAVREKCDRRRDVSPISREGSKRRVKNNKSGDNCPPPTGESPPVDLQGLMGGEGRKGKILTTFERGPPDSSDSARRFVHAVRLYSAQFLSAR